MVRHSKWAQGLSYADLGVVLDHAEERSFEAGAWVAHAGDVVEHWSGVVEGFAKMSVASSHGRVSTLTGVCAGVWYGEGSLIKHEARRYDVYALCPMRMVMLPRQIFEWLRGNSIAFNHYLHDLLNARLSLFIGTLAHDRLLDTDARVAHCLASLFHEDLYPQAARHVQLSQAEIGLLANISRQRANIALQRLQKLGLIHAERRGLTVLDVEGLRRLADEGVAGSGRPPV